MMRKISIITVFLLFTLSIIICLCLGREIRCALTPEVRCAMVSYKEWNGASTVLYPAVPEEAIYSDGAETYLLSLVTSEDFDEEIYILERIEIEIYYRMDGWVYFHFVSKNFIGNVALESEKDWQPGDRVRIWQVD